MDALDVRADTQKLELEGSWKECERADDVDYSFSLNQQKNISSSLEKEDLQMSIT